MSIHLLIDGVRGESADANHAGWMDIQSLKWGTRRRITSHTSTRYDRESANAEISHLFITRHMDSATPALVIEACCGRGKTMRMHLTKTGAGRGADVYAEYTLRHALVSRYSVRVRGRGNARPLEHMIISFTGMEMRYLPYDEDGLPAAPLVQGFDATTNTRL